MTRRKSFSTTREDQIVRVVEKAVTNLRLNVLRGALETLPSNDQEMFIYEELRELPQRVAEAYRSNLKGDDQQELDL